MTPDELARSCVYALLRPRSVFEDSVPVVGIMGSRSVPLPKKHYPKWKYLAFDVHGKPVYHYDAEQVLRALDFHGLIDITNYNDGKHWMLPPMEEPNEAQDSVPAIAD